MDRETITDLLINQLPRDEGKTNEAFARIEEIKDTLNNFIAAQQLAEQITELAGEEVGSRAENKPPGFHESTLVPMGELIADEKIPHRYGYARVWVQNYTDTNKIDLVTKKGQFPFGKGWLRRSYRNSIFRKADNGKTAAYGVDFFYGSIEDEKIVLIKNASSNVYDCHRIERDLARINEEEMETTELLKKIDDKNLYVIDRSQKVLDSLRLVYGAVTASA